MAQDFEVRDITIYGHFGLSSVSIGDGGTGLMLGGSAQVTEDIGFFAEHVRGSGEYLGVDLSSSSTEFAATYTYLETDEFVVRPYAGLGFYSTAWDSNAVGNVEANYTWLLVGALAEYSLAEVLPDYDANLYGRASLLGFSFELGVNAGLPVDGLENLRARASFRQFLEGTLLSVGAEYRL
ncbi:MAG: hypothetical protein AAFQ36_07305 [Pseudomonadota bacterium]